MYKKLIIGGGGRHAIEIMDVLHHQNIFDFFFFDDINPHNLSFLNKYKILKNEEDIKEICSDGFDFILGLAGVTQREIVDNKLKSYGGHPRSIISKTSICGQINIELGEAVNIMHQVMVSSNVRIGYGTLLNAKSSVHHDVVIGDFCEICPGAILLGGCKIGHRTFIGSGAIILPDVIIGNDVVIGAGSIVTKNIADSSKIKGIPAK